VSADQSILEWDAILSELEGGGDALSAEWVPPVGLSAIPAQFVSRAQRVLAGLSVKIVAAEDDLRATSRDLAALRSSRRVKVETTAVYLDVTG
jgi:hypothetical protein